MNKKTYTLLVMTNRKGRTFSFSLSSAWIKSSSILFGVFMVLLAASVVDYMGLLLESGESKRLRAENAQLRGQFESIESKVQSLENSLDRVKNFSTKLKLITNIDDKDRVTKLALGPEPKLGQHLEGLGFSEGPRQPASELLTKESLFLLSPPKDEKKGELAKSLSNSYATLSVRIDRVVRQTALHEQGVIELWETLSERRSLLNATPSIKPARGWLTSRFGYRVDPFTGKPTMHSGLDIAAPPGGPVYAPGDGVVSYVGYEQGYGKLVSIDHGYGIVTRYGHNSQIFVQLGQKVTRHDVIAAVGNTGRSSGTHLHYEVRVHGIPVDPINYILSE